MVIHPPETLVHPFITTAAMTRIQATDQTAHAGAEDHVYGYALLLEETQGADVGRALGAAAAEHESNRRAAAPYAVHPCLHLRHHDGVSDGVIALETDLGARRSGERQAGQQKQKYP